MARFQIILKVVAIHLALFAGPAVAQTTDAIKKVRDSVIYLRVSFKGTGGGEPDCKLQNNWWQGSGFILTKSGYALTAAHVIEYPEGCPITATRVIESRVGYSQTGDWIPVESVATDVGVDTALIKLAERKDGYKPLEVCFVQEEPARQEYLGLGFPDGREYSNVNLRYQNSNGPGGSWTVASFAIHGMSGGPMIDARSRAIGIIKGSIRRSTSTGRLVTPLSFASSLMAKAAILPARCDSPPARLQNNTPPDGKFFFQKAMDNLRLNQDEKYFSNISKANREGLVEASAALSLIYYFGIGTSVDTEFAEKYARSALDKGLASAANAGNRDAQYMYGLLLVNGIGLEKDIEEGVRQLENAYLNGHLRAPMQIAHQYRINSTSADDCKGIELARISRKQGHLSAYAAEGRYYLDGLCTEKGDAQDAYPLIAYSAEAGDTESERLLGWMYENNSGVPKNENNDQLAVSWYDKAAKKGDRWAQNNLGLMYANNRGVPASEKNDETAVALYRKAAEEGNASAINNLGWMYQNNRGVPSSDRNDETAVRYYKQAAELGDAWAQKNLGWMYENNRGVPVSEKNDETAVALYRKAAEQGNASAINNLGWMYQNNRGVPSSERNNETAVGYYKQAAELGNETAQVNLGNMYEQNLGVPIAPNRLERAAHWYRKAISQGSNRARYRLALLMMNGKELNSKDLAQGISLLEKASSEGYGTASAELGRILIQFEDAYSHNKALAYLKKAFEQKSSYGAYLLAELYFRFDGDYTCKIDDKIVLSLTRKEALQALEFSAKEKNSCAENLMGTSYETGYLHRKDDLKALEYYEKSGSSGNQNGKYNYERLRKLVGSRSAQEKFSSRRGGSLVDTDHVASLCSLLYESAFSEIAKSYRSVGYYLKKLEEQGVYEGEEGEILLKKIIKDPDSVKDVSVCSPMKDGRILIDGLLFR